MNKNDVNKLIETLRNVSDTIYNTTYDFLKEHKSAFIDQIIIDEDGNYVFTEDREEPDNYVFVEVEEYYNAPQYIRAFGLEMSCDKILVYGMNDDYEINVYDYNDVICGKRGNLLEILADGEPYEIPTEE